MKNLVKYLLVFMIVAFFHAAGRIATISVNDSSGIDIEDVVSDDSFESPDAEFSVQRQIQFTGSFVSVSW